ncbi:hypothetical protein CVT26_009617 [Gymnopilus dilepis]|uniref:Uncharacterized protein n=1 Tax=Gymnopilus dilepis TaxID=231916 RepID=A0A409VKS8_9AGAR|nr:hypothetical protein CVT26_009617 [Gymnopilus dilepis]
MSNPTFLHPPAQPKQEPSPAPTLGALVESVRASKSSLKQQHSVLQLPSSTATVENNDAPAERALHQLDIYKTPLVPTRLRSSNIPASVAAATTPDLFKSRRSSRLILMQDDRDRPGRRSAGKSPVVNETKPYAGEGGMKKLLARRKQEEEEEGGKEPESTPAEEPTPRPRQTSPTPVAPPPAPPASDWFSTATSAPPASGSSLRVGRTKISRNHIQRPSRPSKARFSAVYEEDADDAMDDDETRQKEREMLEEAAKKAPVFNIPADFSFAKDAPPVKPADLDKAKEPPITSLPFSFAKPTTTPAVPAPSAPATVPVENKAVEPSPAPATESKPVVVFSSPAGGVPNFFANSQVLAKAKETSVPTPTLNFGLPPAPAPQPVKDNENPFWDGEKKTAAAEPKAPPAFNFFGAKEGESKGLPSNAPVSLFPSLPKPATEPASTLPFSFGKPATEEAKPAEPPKLPFSFGQPSETKKVETEAAAAKPAFGSGTSFFGDASKSSGSLFGQPPKPADVELKQASLSISEQPKTDATSFPEQPKTTSPFETVAPPQPTPSPLPFTFGAPQTAASAAPPAGVATPPPEPASKPSFFSAPSSSTIEAPKPLFGGNNVFSFGQPPAADKDKESKPSTSFSFGATTTPAPESKPAVFSFGPPQPSTTAPATTTPAPESKPAVFSFGQPQPSSTTPAPAPATNGAAPLAFSFSSGGSTAGDVSNKTPFMFGQPTSLAPTERPVTPPKNNEQDSRMDESPTRDLQQVNGTKPTSAMNGGFSFGSGSSTTNGGSLFGGQSNTAPSFSFGASSSAASNPFAPKDNKDATASKGFGGFGQAPAPIMTSFSFGQTSKPAEEPQRPATAGAFSFGATPTSATSGTPAFSFGQPPASNPFGQSGSGSAPSSPSTFNQPSSFGFGATTPSSTAPFSFGSQPNSPAGGANLTLPAGGFGSGAPFGQAQQPQPSSPFSAPIALAPSTSGGAGGGGALFTIGAAPAPAPAGGPRQIKKLPTRRAGAKR